MNETLMAQKNGKREEFEAALYAMEQLRDDGWCVVLKCLPREMGWLVEGSRSEYDAPARDTRVGAGTWYCEIQDVRRAELWRASRYAMHKDPLQAVMRVWEMAWPQIPERNDTGEASRVTPKEIKVKGDTDER